MQCGCGPLDRQYQLDGVEYRRWVEEGEIADVAGEFGFPGRMSQ